MEIEIKLDDPTRCNGCPIISENHIFDCINCEEGKKHYDCNLDYFMRRCKIPKRPQACIDKHDKPDISTLNGYNPPPKEENRPEKPTPLPPRGMRMLDRQRDVLQELSKICLRLAKLERAANED